MSNIVEISYENKKEIYELDSVACQASGSILLRQGNAVMLASVARDEDIVDGDFVPLTVSYIEKSYAAAKFPSGFIKRESKPSDFETLTSRIIDRSLRPLFPNGYSYPTTIVIFLLSSDMDVDLQVMALNAASAALFVSDIPVNKSVSGVRIAKIDGEYIVNPTSKELDSSSLDLYVAGSDEELLMIEMKTLSSESSMNELSEEESIKAIELASSFLQDSTKKIRQTLGSYKKREAILELKSKNSSDNLLGYIDENFKDRVLDAISAMAKSERSSHLAKIAKDIAESKEAIDNFWDIELVGSVLDEYKKSLVRSMILDSHTRADGRGLEDVRVIDIKTNILPSVHSSCLFTRGETQALVTATLGGSKDAQQFERINLKESQFENFMVHYNFPGFSVGEASPLRAPGRRELGHGNLAKRALESSFNIKPDETVRLVSDILGSNGSSSMATVCGGSLALKASGIEVKKLIAGVAMGLIVDGDRYAILTDIMGLEDHDGDMDFKVAGSKDGITALQMDIKLGGLDLSILKEALYQASRARLHILSIMQEASESIVVNKDILPTVVTFSLNPSTFGAIIGKGGENIKGIIEKFSVEVDLDRDSGMVKIIGDNQESIEEAKNYIIEFSKKSREAKVGASRDSKRDTPKFSEGQIFDVEVKRVVDFGAFVELPGGVDGLIHISKLSDDRVDKVTDMIDIGDRVKIKVLAQRGHKIELGLIEKL
jgi:polyribonucleotide nucleotidyltransferase